VGFFSLTKDTKPESETLCNENQTLLNAQYINCASSQAFGLYYYYYYFVFCFYCGISLHLCGIATHNGPIVHPYVGMNGYRTLFEWWLAGEFRSTRSKTCFSATWTTEILSWTGQGLNPVAHGDKPATNRVNRSAAFEISRPNYACNCSEILKMCLRYAIMSKKDFFFFLPWGETVFLLRCGLRRSHRAFAGWWNEWTSSDSVQVTDRERRIARRIRWYIHQPCASRIFGIEPGSLRCGDWR
jgi:hypothetical protein